MSKEQMDRCHFWMNSVHKCVDDLEAARSGCALGSTANPEKEGRSPCLWPEGLRLPDESGEFMLVI
jgi:hypothetical protein